MLSKYSTVFLVFRRKQMTIYNLSRSLLYSYTFVSDIKIKTARTKGLKLLVVSGVRAEGRAPACGAHGIQGAGAVRAKGLREAGRGCPRQEPCCQGGWGPRPRGSGAGLGVLTRHQSLCPEHCRLTRFTPVTRWRQLWDLTYRQFPED